MIAFLRRRGRLLLGMVVAGIVLAPVAYWLRPLNRVERRLVGTWVLDPEGMPPGMAQMHLRRDRGFVVTWSDGQTTERGDWAVAGDRLRMRPFIPWSATWGGVWHQIEERVRGTQVHYMTRSLRFESDDRVIFDDNPTQLWERSPADAPPPR